MLRTEKERLLARLGKSHYRIKNLEGEIQVIEGEREREVQQSLRDRRATQLEQMAQAEQMIQGRLEKLRPKIAAASTRLTDLQEQITQRQNNYDRIQQDLQERGKDRQRAGIAGQNVRVQQRHPDSVTVAVQSKPSRPKLTSPRKAVVIPAVALLVVGLGQPGCSSKNSWISVSRRRWM